MDTGNIDETYATDQGGRMALLVQSKAQFLAFLARYLGNRAEAEDLLQTAYLKALTASETVRNDEKVRAWFYRVLRNVVVDAHRHRAATERLEAQLIREAPGMTVPDEALFHTVCQCVLDIAHTLKPEYRDILQRVELEEASLSTGHRKKVALWYFPGCKNNVLSTGYVNLSMLQPSERRVQRCARPLRFHSTSPM
jgi:RNA polymerase sigma factor (sigma-70 family)